MYPLQLGNYVLIVIGAILVASGPYIVYRTVRTLLARRRDKSRPELHLLSEGLNLVIAVLFFGAGILFILNNLRGNQFA